MTDDTESDSPTGRTLCTTDGLLMRVVTIMSKSANPGPSREKDAHTKVAELTPLLSGGEMPPRRTNSQDHT
jgi:hypothetical protein